MAASADFRKQAAGFGLTTAKILYHFPDAPQIINPNFFVWQEYDVCPRFPRLMAYLAFWQKDIEGKLHSVMVMHSGLIKPAELNALSGELRLN